MIKFTWEHSNQNFGLWSERHLNSVRVTLTTQCLSCELVGGCKVDAAAAPTGRGGKAPDQLTVEHLHLRVVLRGKQQSTVGTWTHKQTLNNPSNNLYLRQILVVLFLVMNLKMLKLLDTFKFISIKCQIHCFKWIIFHNLTFPTLAAAAKTPAPFLGIPGIRTASTKYWTGMHKVSKLNFV